MADRDSGDWAGFYLSYFLKIKEISVQTMGKANNTEESVIEAKPLAFDIQCLTMPKRLGLFTFALTAGLMLTAGSVLAEPSFPTLTAANSPVENTGQNVRDREVQAY